MVSTASHILEVYIKDKDIKNNQITILEVPQKNVDDSIVELADQQTIIATNDKELTKRLKDKNVKVIYLRARKRLDLR